MRLCIFMGILLTAVSSCTSSLWGISVEDWNRAKKEGNFSFLRSLELTPGNLPDLSFLGPGASYSLGILLEKEGRTEDSLRFLTASLEREAEPYPQWAYERLSGHFLKGNNWPQLEHWSRKYLEGNPESLTAARDLVEALYWQKKDVEVLFRIAAGRWKDLNVPQARELDLFRAVSALRTAHPEGPLYWKNFLQTQPASSLHYRAYTFFEEEPLRYNFLNLPDRELLRFKAMVGERKYADAWESFRTLQGLEGFRPDIVLLGDLGRLVPSVENPALLLSGLTEILPLVEPSARWLGLLHQGRLAFRGGQRKLGEEYFSQALNQAPQEADKRRITLELLDNHLRKDRTAFVATLEVQGDREVISALGSRKLEDFRAELLRTGGWELLFRTWKVIAFHGPESMKASWAYVMVRLDQSGLLPGAYRIGDTSSLVRQIREWDPLGYSALVLADLQSIPWKIPLSSGTEADTRESPEGRAYKELAAFGLSYHAYEKFWSSSDEVSSLESLRFLAASLADRGHYLESQRIMIRAARRFPLYTEADWKLRYPLAFAEEITRTAQEAGIDQDLFRSLVREESFYDPDISSPVGARGLSQLMPATAQAMMTKLRLDKSSSLTDPLVNLTIGSRYLAERLRDFGSPSKALMAYNGGQGRVRTWTREFGHLPADLFVEACPLEETRNYVKKIYVTASLYHRLYGRSALALPLIYPGLKQ